MSRALLIYLGGLLLAYLSVLLLGTGVGGEEASHILLRITAPWVELGLTFVIAESLTHGSAVGGWRSIRWLSALIFTVVVGAIYISQTLTLRLSSNFVTVLALENSAEGRLVRGTSFYVAVAVGLAWTTLFAWLAWVDWKRPIREQSKGGRRSYYATAALLTIAFVWLLRHQDNGSRLEAGYRQTPVASLLHTGVNLYRAHVAYGQDDPTEASSDETATSRGRYPFEKMRIFRHDLPFPRSENVARAMPNVIVIFTEGMSARLIGAYGGKYPNLTPNIDRLASRTMRVDNYFNHTAATYRGLQGQLVSGYPEAGGSGESLSWDERGAELRRVRYQSIPLLLRDVGYQSYFFSPHPDSVSLNDLLRAMGFDSVFSAETALSHSDTYRTRLLGGSLNDRDVFGELIRFLEKRSADHARRPFFIGTYNIGTHAFAQPLVTGVRYSQAANSVLDRFHNYDAEAGRFFDYFFASPYAKNTIFIFTTDHATYPEPPFREIAGNDYKPYFVDRIPLLVYDPFHLLPPTFDARGNNSLSLAPTLMQLLGIRSGANSFVGRSIFSQHREAFAVTAIGQEFFATDANAAYSESEIPEAYRARFAYRKQQIELYYRLERENRIFQPTH